MDIPSYRRKARAYIDGIISTKSPSVFPDFAELRSFNLHYLLERVDLRSHVEDVQHISEDIIILQGFLAETELPNDDESTTIAVAATQTILLSAIRPTRASQNASIDASNQVLEHAKDEISKYHVMTFNALLVLDQLYEQFPLPGEAESDIVAFLTSISSFTDLNDPWTYEASNKVASKLLVSFMDRQNLQSRSNALTVLLREKIKPAFSKTRNPALTPQLRKATNPLPVYSVASSELDDKPKPWKIHDPSITTVLGWVIESLRCLDVRSSQSSFVQLNWPLLIPPLLALIDDSSTAYKAKGCAFLRVLLHKTPSLLLHETGLGEVLEDSLMPCLLYLPSMTQEAESLTLLNEAYPALIRLACVRFQERQEHPMKMAAMDKVMRNGILNGYSQAGEHVKIANSLVTWMGEVVNEIGIEVVMHLKHLLPLLSANLANPLALMYPPLAMSSLRTLQTIMLIAWPQILFYRGEILAGLTVFWCMVEEQDEWSTELEAIRESLRITVRILWAILEHSVIATEEYRILIQGDKRLEGMVPV